MRSGETPRARAPLRSGRGPEILKGPELWCRQRGVPCSLGRPMVAGASPTERSHVVIEEQIVPPHPACLPALVLRKVLGVSQR